MKRLLLAALPFALLAAGCGGSSSSNTTETPNLTFNVDVTSQGTFLQALGNKTSGSNRLTGTTTINGEAASVETLAHVAYTDGSGPFYGFINVTFADSSVLVLQMNGIATRNATTTDTAFVSPVTIFSGSGRYAGATGRGNFTGTREAALGGVVHMNVGVRIN